VVKGKIIVIESPESQALAEKISFSAPSLNNGQKCRKLVFMRVPGICFIEWLWFGSICGNNNDN